MTEIALRDNTDVALASVDTFTRLAAWAESANAAHQVATRLVQTSFVPEAFRGKPGEATAAILAGAELGFDPMASLRAFDVIQGTAAPRANTLRAVVQSQGHEILLVESTQTRAVVKGRRKGQHEWQQSIWTIERAQKMALTNKHNWKVQPQAMLVARATAECARLVASDAILGIGYAAEELSDEVMPDVVEAKAPKRRTAQRAQVQPEPAAEPEFDEQLAEAVPVSAVPVSAQPAGDGITDAQMRLMQKLFTEAGITDREDKLNYATQVTGKALNSAKELTKDEAGRVIDALSTVAEPEFDDAPEAGE